MNALAAEKLSALRSMLEDRSGGTAVLKVQPKSEPPPSRDATPTKATKPVQKRKMPSHDIELPDDEPDERDCERVGAVLRTVFGRKMCLDPKTSVIPGSPKVSRKPAAKNEWPESWAERAEQLGWLSEHLDVGCNCG